MKRKIAWVTDSVSCIPPQLAKEKGMYVVPLSLIFGETIYKDGIDLTVEEFYAQLKEADKLPTTSQPSVGEFVELYEKLKEEYEMGIAIHVTSKVSGTYNSSVMAAEMAGFPMVHIDSKIGAKALEYMMLEGIRLEQEGVSTEEIVTRLQQMPNEVRGLNLIGSLEQMHKGGRVSGLGLLLGNLFQIKPILEFQDGALVPLEKVRTMKKAENRIFELFKQSYDSYSLYGVSIIHSEILEKAEEWKQRLLEIDPNFNVEIGPLSPVVGTHVGAGTIGLMWFERRT
ncbi:DegV family protein [Metabacillus iocasae]|uniref:DegV family protein with EDD domain n=1 Tax=Priestia iocasae TaxID=2291674 RepID=A0ABS2QW96_9BACI|nr:DegV family protein [Metabacillus iocasae]MBM7703670.1 DegV family protein with EDD domain [Metabacillus iocasae]